MAVVDVSDTGAGIAASNLERIFELFMQEHPSGFAGNTGLGIEMLAMSGFTITRV